MRNEFHGFLAVVDHPVRGTARHPECHLERTGGRPMTPTSPTQGEKPGATAFSGAGAQVRREHKALEAALETYRSEKPSFAKATEDRPAEARALAELVVAYFGHTRPDDYMNCDQQIYDMAQALLPPQGATASFAPCFAEATQDEKATESKAVGADELRNATLEEAAQIADRMLGNGPIVAKHIRRAMGPLPSISSSPSADSICRDLRLTAEYEAQQQGILKEERAEWQAAARIEALQRQVADLTRRCEAATGLQYTLDNAVERAEAAESSLRTLGDALERARGALERYDNFSLVIESAVRNADPGHIGSVREVIRLGRTALHLAREAFTPPTRDTSCEAATLSSQDANVEAVKRLLDERSARGLVKYGVPTSAAGLTVEQWTQHLIEELADALVYLMARLATPSSPSDKGADE